MRTGPQQFFLGLGIGYGVLFPISWDSSLFYDWNEIDITVEGSLLARTIWAGSKATLTARANIPLVRVSFLSNSNKFLSLNVQEQIIYFPEENSTGTSSTVGLQFQFSSFGISVNSTYPDGNQNPSFTRFPDRNPIHSITFFGEL